MSFLRPAPPCVSFLGRCPSTVRPVFPMLVFQLSKQQNRTRTTSSTVLGTPPNRTLTKKFPLEGLRGRLLSYPVSPYPLDLRGEESPPKFRGRSVRNPLFYSVFCRPPLNLESDSSPLKFRGMGLQGSWVLNCEFSQLGTVHETVFGHRQKDPCPFFLSDTKISGQ